MRVYCRFAPLAESAPPPAAVFVSVRGGSAAAALTVTAPGAGGSVSCACARAFLPGPAPQQQTQEKQQSQEEQEQEKEKRKSREKQQQREVFDEVVRPCVSGLLRGRRCAFLAYGQTATGKTYTIFGPDVAVGDDETFPGSSGAKENESEEEEEEEEGEDREKEMDEDNTGLVPRLLRDLFSEHGASVGCVDLSCIEVYNECATDLVALQLRQQQQQQRPQQRTHSSRRRSGARQTEPNDYHHNNSGLTAAWLAWARSERDERTSLSDVSSVRTTYRPTEKSLVMRSALRLRAASAAACWTLIRRLLALRQCSQTERNVRSSRSHLLLRLELRGALPDTPRLGEALFADLAGSESYRDHGWAQDRNGAAHDNHDTVNNGNSSRVDAVRGNHNVQNSLRALRRNPIVASTFAANLCDDSGFTAAQRTALKANEMRHINSSLLALRKVLRSLHTATAAAAASSSTSSLSVSTAYSLPSTSAANTGAAGGILNSPVLVTAHIPFRDSTLTTILEPFLVPGGKTSTIAWVVCCSMKQRDFHETIESLRLGADACAIPASVQLSQTLPSRAADASDASQNGPLPQSPLLDTNANANVTTTTTTTTATKAPSEAVVQRGSRSDLSATSGSSDDGELRKELDAYKRYAQQLLEQCNGLCDSYNECVEELLRTKEALAARDREIAEMRRSQCSPIVSSLPQEKETRDKTAPRTPDEEAMRLVESILRRHSAQKDSGTVSAGQNAQ